MPSFNLPHGPCVTACCLSMRVVCVLCEAVLIQGGREEDSRRRICDSYAVTNDDAFRGKPSEASDGFVERRKANKPPQAIINHNHTTSTRRPRIRIFLSSPTFLGLVYLYCIQPITG
jgi:hypothetical protein